jgi:hypothetical protein
MARGGRPAWKPTARERETVKTLTGYGIPQDAICAILKVTRPTLEKRCRVELDTGAADANAQVAGSMFRMAMKAPYAVRFQAAKYWLACRAEWKERPPVTLDMLIPIDRMTDEQFDAVMRINGLPTVGGASPPPLPTKTNVVPYRPRP